MEPGVCLGIAEGSGVALRHMLESEGAGEEIPALKGRATIRVPRCGTGGEPNQTFTVFDPAFALSVAFKPASVWASGLSLPIFTV
jgi:hypothetical protein